MEICFQCHPKFEDELGRLGRGHPTTNIDYKHLCKLLSLHFDPDNPVLSISPKNLKRVDNVGSNIRVYKVNMAIQGLSKGQSPRVYIWLETQTIWFLCMGTHVDNYDDSKLRELAKKRIMELNPNIKP